MRCVLVGNYGVGNLGDEALRDYFLTAFPAVEWRVISAQPRAGELPRLPAGLRSLSTTPWWKTIGALRRADAMVFGGGSLFTDVESVRACILWGLHAWVARLCGAKVILAFQGIGPFRTRLGTWIAKHVLAHASFLSVRDRESAARVAEFLLNINSVQSADPVFLQLQNSVYNSIKNVIIALPRHNSSPAMIAALHEEFERHPDMQLQIVSMQPDHAQEHAACEALREAFAERNPLVVPVRTLEELHSALGNAALVVTERYHGALAAVAMGKAVRILHQGSGDKHQALADLVQRNGLEGARHELLGLAEAGEDALRTALSAA